MLGSESARGARPGLVDSTVLIQDQRFAGFRAVKNYRFMVNPSIQVGLKVSAHGSMHGAGKQAEDHPIGMMDSAPRQLEAAAQGDLLERVFDRPDHLVDRENLADRSVF